MVAKATEFETLRVLHNLWRSNQITAVEIKTILKDQYDINLTVLAIGEIKAESLDGKTKYSIK